MELMTDKKKRGFYKFTKKERLVITHYLLNGNVPRYGTLIHKEITNGSISKPKALEVCDKFEKRGIFQYKRIRPDGQKNTTEYYYLNSDNSAFYEIAHNFLFTDNDYDKYIFLNSEYVQEKLSIDFISNCLHGLGYYNEVFFTLDQFPDEDQWQYKQWLTAVMQEKGYEVEYSDEKITPKGVQDRLDDLDFQGDLKRIAETDLSQKYVVYTSGTEILVKFPFFPEDMSEEGQKKLFQETNPDLPPFFYDMTIVQNYYRKDTGEIRLFLDKCLALISISPSAFRDLLFFTINEALMKHQDSGETVYQSYFHLLMTDPNKALLPRLVINTVYDLTKTSHLPKNSRVERVDVLYDPESKQLTHQMLKIVFDDGFESSYPLGFTMNKKGFIKYRGGV